MVVRRAAVVATAGAAVVRAGVATHPGVVNYPGGSLILLCPLSGQQLRERGKRSLLHFWPLTANCSRLVLQLPLCGGRRRRRRPRSPPLHHCSMRRQEDRGGGREPLLATRTKRVEGGVEEVREGERSGK